MLSQHFRAVVRAAGRDSLARQKCLLLAAFLFSALVLSRVLWSLSPGVLGATACGAVCAYGAWRGLGERRLCLALLAACVAWALGMLLGSRSVAGLPLRFSDLGAFGFAGGATLAHLAWPEVRRGTAGLAATLGDALTVVAALALWGSAGFVPLGMVVPGLSIESAARPIAVLLPLAASLAVAPQLGDMRRSSGVALAGAMAALAAAELAQGRVFVSGDRLVGIVWVLHASAFTAMVWGVLTAGPLKAVEQAPRADEGAPPGVIPGLLAAGAFVAAVLGPVSPGPQAAVLAVFLGVCLGARELLHGRERRRTSQRLAAAFEVGARVAHLQAQDGGIPRQGLEEVCDAAAEALKADAVLLWIRQGDVLVLTAAGPQRLDGRAARRIRVDSRSDLSAQVVRTGAPEVREVAVPGFGADEWLARFTGAVTFLGVPISRDDQVMGALVLGRKPGSELFAPSDQWKATLVGSQIAALLCSSTRHDELEARLSQTDLVYRFAMEAASARNVNEIGSQLLSAVGARLAFDRGSVRLVDASTPGGLRPIAHWTRRTSQLNGGTASSLRAPLEYGSLAVGEMVLERFGGRPFAAMEEHALRTLASFGAMVLHNRRLKEESEQVSTYQYRDQAKTDLLRTVSHDLRHSLGVIRGYAARLIESGQRLPGEERMLSLRTIEEEAGRLADLLGHLLDLSAIEAGRLSLELQAVNLRRVVDQSLASREGLEHGLDCEVPEGLLVTADRRRLRQVLDNLLDNAVKYSPEGGIIRVGAAVNPEEVVISIADSGIGIPRHLWGRIFRPYERDETGRSRGIMGTGLGLAICKGIVEAHGGRIWVESEPGVGSIFFFTMSPGPELPPGEEIGA